MESELVFEVSMSILRSRVTFKGSCVSVLSRSLFFLCRTRVFTNRVELLTIVFEIMSSVTVEESCDFDSVAMVI